MRALTAELEMNAKTFAPELVLMLDNEPTGVVVPMEPLRDIDPADEQKVIKSTISKLHRKHKLTKEEKKYYTDNFRALVTRSVKRLI